MAGVKELIAQMADSLPIAFMSSMDNEGYPYTKAMLAPRKREGITTFYFTTNTFSLRVAHYKANPKASIYFCDEKGFKGMMLRGTMEVLTDAKYDGDFDRIYSEGYNSKSYQGRVIYDSEACRCVAIGTSSPFLPLPLSEFPNYPFQPFGMVKQNKFLHEYPKLFLSLHPIKTKMIWTSKHFRNS